MIYPALKVEKTMEWKGDGVTIKKADEEKKRDWTGSLCFEYHGEKYAFYF